MALFDWDNEYSVGVSLMDSHHKKLFDIINKLHADVKGGRSEAQIGPHIKELLDYTIYHFGEEEKMLAACGYPTLAAHQELHKKFIGELQSAKQDVDDNMAIFAATRVMNQSTEWLKHHILTVDKGYEQLVKSHGY